MESLPERMLSALARQLDPRLHTRLYWFRERVRGRAPEIPIIRSLVAPGDVAIDVGAHRGLYVGVFAAAVGERGHVHAFEPNPGLWGHLESVASAYKNVKLYRVALSDRSGTSTLHVPLVEDEELDAFGSLVNRYHRRASKSWPVFARRLDEVITLEVPVAFVKCDVEGHELSVLAGSERILRECRPSLLVEIEARHSEKPVAETLEYLDRLEYAGFFFRGNRLLPIEEFSLDRDQLAFAGRDLAEPMPSGYVGNFLFVHRRSRVDRVTRFLGVNLRGPRIARLR